MSNRKRSSGSARTAFLGGTAIAAAILAVFVVRDLAGPAAEIPVCAPDQPVQAGMPSPPDEVFCYDATATADEVRIEFVIDEGGYLYRDKLEFSSADPAVQLASPQFPSGEMHSDEFFGEQEIYRGRFEVAIPYTRTAAVDAFDFELGLQGCDELIGLCYPPQDWVATVALPPGPLAAEAVGADAVPAVAAAGDLSGSIFAGATSDEPLPVDEAFVGNPRFDAANELTVAWQITPGYYLYRDQFRFDVDGEIQLGSPVYPESIAHNDESYGDTEVYYDYVEVVVPFARSHPDEQTLTLAAGFQGCKEGSICYPVSEQVFALTLPAVSEFAGIAPGVAASGGAATTAAATTPVMVSEQDALAELISNGALLAVIGTFFVAGLGLSLTPCVYPMIPILSSIIAGQGDISRGRSFALSVSYVLGMAVTYSAAGALTAMAGSQVQAVFQQPWIIVTVAALFVVMAMAMFGLFEIQVPSFIQSRISAIADRQKSGSFFGTAVIGALSALIVTTCVAPPLIAGLISIGQSGDVARGSMALFVLALGMGVPLLLIGASAGQLLPKVGPWMNTIKAAFGVLMIGMAIWMLDRILAGTVTLYMWALLVFLTGVFLGAFDALPESPRPARRLAKGVGVLACLYGALMLIGATLGGEHPTRPIPITGGLMGQVADRPEAEFVAIESVGELETLLGQARNAGQPVMVEFTADWCVSCKEMEAYTFPDPGVVAALDSYLLLRADVTDVDDDAQALLDHFGIYGPPTMAFYDRNGTELYPYRLVGYVEADDFAAHATTVANL